MLKTLYKQQIHSTTEPLPIIYTLKTAAATTNRIFFFIIAAQITQMLLYL
jgi:hypothetical protein